MSWAEREAVALVRVQRVLLSGSGTDSGATGSGVTRAAKALSLVGEHAGGWLLVGGVGALIDRSRRREWLLAAAGVATAHATAIAVKRGVRRRRPEHPDVRVLAGTPSALSFPSAHATSTTAAAVLYGGLLRRRLVPLLVPPMLASRLALGVHYPSDLVAGSLLGAVVASTFRSLTRRRASSSSTNIRAPFSSTSTRRAVR